MSRLFWCVLLAGCGRLEFERLTPDDGPIPGPSCWAAWRTGAPTFTSIRLVDELGSTLNQTDASLSSDGLSMWFAREDASMFDLYEATREEPRGPWSATRLVSELNTNEADLRLSATADGLEAVYGSSRTGSAGIDLWGTRRLAPTDPWLPLTRMDLAAVNTASNENNAELSPDGLTLYVSIGPLGTQKIHRATRTARTQPFGSPAEMTELAVLTRQADLTVSPDGLVGVFSARDDDPCLVTEPCFDLFVTTRDDTTAPFGPPAALPMLNQLGAQEADAELSSDGCELYFTRTVSTRLEIHVATVEPS